MTIDSRVLCSLLIISAVFPLGTTFYSYPYQLCCQDTYSPWRGQHYNHHHASGYIPAYRWPESTYRIPHYFFKPPLNYYHYDPCRYYIKKCHISLFYKCCYDCCNNLRCSVVFDSRYTTTASTTRVNTSTTEELTTILNTTPEDTLTVMIPTTTEEITTILSTTLEDTSTIMIPTTTEEITTILNTTLENLTPITTETPSSTIIDVAGGSGDSSGDGSGDGDNDSGSGDPPVTEVEPGIQRRHVIIEDDDEDFIFIE